MLPLVTVSQLALLVAVHAQPLPDVTATLAAPPEAGLVSLAGETVKVHPAPFCTTYTFRPATVSSPVRVICELFRPADTPTVPFPLPLLPFVTVSQAALVVAVQAQPVPAITEKLVAPPLATTV
jgi:hypothetical protein